MSHFVIALPAFNSQPPEAAEAPATFAEADENARHELDRLSLSSEPLTAAYMRMSLAEVDEEARREMDRLSLHSEFWPLAEPADELANLSLTIPAR
jgi:hypothetical protein